MTTVSMGGTGNRHSAAPAPDTNPDHGFQQFALQVLSLLLYGGFAIVATILAFINFWPAGLLLAMFLAWRGFAPTGRSRGEAAVEQAIGKVIPAADTLRNTGNKSFDAYRAQLMQRLEDEQKGFEDFLVRLRDAKDEREFDQFMDDRAAKARQVDQTVAARVTA
jgi:hypothetical protein